MSNFEIADDFVPRTGAGRTNPYVDAVLEGHTVFIPGMEQHGIAGRFSRVRMTGAKVRSQKGERGGVTGVYVWAEKNGQHP